MKQSIAAFGTAFLLGSASLTFAQQTYKEMQQALEQQGYSQVHNFKEIGQGTSVQAMKDGQNWTIVLSHQGQIVRRVPTGEPQQGTPGAFAQGNTSATGVTSGPAAGMPTAPNTAVPKQSWSATSSAAATGAGAPGTPAKPGTEAGAAPQKSTSQ
ncbi:MAG: hypothetical protein JO122_04105 [Acetobacteraceae bacterium]|nr:hypothetical protein [Acetobacteraceae bacterium]